MRGTGTAEIIRNDNDTYRIVAEVSVPMRTWADDGPEVQIATVYGPDGLVLGTEAFLAFIETMSETERLSIEAQAIDSFGTAMAEDRAAREGSYGSLSA